MRVAFYAPMKPPDHPVPSGDRTMARALCRALSLAGHEVELACHFVSRDGRGDIPRQARLAALGQRLADALLRRFQARPAAQRPKAWLTYHLYYKAPDYLGPRISQGLGIPYLVAEASVANKRAGGSWDQGHRATLDALDAADLVIGLNPSDQDCLPDPSKGRLLPPFLDPAPLQAAAAGRKDHRTALARSQDLDPNTPWLLTVAMMRPGDKLASYQILSEALQKLQDRPWRLLLVGDGPARSDVEKAFASLPADRLCFLGQRSGAELPALYAAADLFLWPAINEAYGLALLEAQAAGLPVIAGASGGVPSIVKDGRTGRLVPPGQVSAFAEAVGELLHHRHGMAQAARESVQADHSLATAAQRLDGFLREVSAT